MSYVTVFVSSFSIVLQRMILLSPMLYKKPMISEAVGFVLHKGVHKPDWLIWDLFFLLCSSPKMVHRGKSHLSSTKLLICSRWCWLWIIQLRWVLLLLLQFEVNHSFFGSCTVYWSCSSVGNEVYFEVLSTCIWAYREL